MTVLILPVQLMALTPFLFLLGAMVCAIVWNPLIGRALAVAISAVVAAGLWRALAVLAPGAGVEWAYADWSPGARSELRLDALSGPVALIAALAALLGGLVGWERGAGGPAAILRLAWAGAACGAAFSTDWLEAAAWLTGTGLALSALIAVHGSAATRATAWAGHVFVWQALAGGVVMLGLGLVFANSGGLEPETVSVMLDGARRDPLAFVGVALVSVGLAAFAGLAPFHGGGIGAGVAVGLDGALAIVATSLVGFLCFLRIEGAFLTVWSAGMGVWLLGLGVLAACLAASQMAMASNLRAVALLAWSSQLGVALIGLVAHGAQASVLHLLASTLAVMALLMGGHLLERAYGDMPLGRMHGLGRRAPIAGGAIVVAMLSLTGAPFTIGFVSRFGVMEAVVAEAGLLAAAALVLTALLGMWVAARLIQTLFLNAPDGSAEVGPSAAHASIRPAWISLPITFSLGVACLYFGLAQPLAASAAPAAILERINGR